jgi:hypothetical protein
VTARSRIFPAVFRPGDPRHANVTTLLSLVKSRPRSRIASVYLTTMADEKTTEYVTLVSNDQYEFKILRSAACIAGTIKKALDPSCMHIAI